MPPACGLQDAIIRFMAPLLWNYSARCGADQEKNESPVDSDAPAQKRGGQWPASLPAELHKHHTRKPLPLAVLTGCSGCAEPVREPCSPFRQPGDLLAKAHGFASRPCDRFALIEDGRRRPMCGARSKVQTTDEGTSAKSGDESDPPGLPESRSRPGGSRRRIAFCTQQT